MHITGPEGGDPCKIGVAMTDLSTGLYCHGAIMTALFERFRTDRGQRIECSLLETQVASLVNVASAYLNGGVESRRMGTSHGSIVPYQAFGTADGHIVVAAMNDDQFSRLCTRLKLPELPIDPRFVTNPLRVANREDLLPLLQERFVQHTTTEWMEILDGSGLACGPTNTIAQVFEDPQVLHRNMVMELNHPTAGTLRLPGKPVKTAQGHEEPSTPLASTRPPPLLGEHTSEVLVELGYSDKEVHSLLANGVVQNYT